MNINFLIIWFCFAHLLHVFFLIFYMFVFLLLDIKVMQADMLELPFDDECFDLVIEKGTMVN